MAKLTVGAGKGPLDVEIEGLDELIKQFEELPKRSRGELRKAMRRAGTIVAGDVRARLRSSERTGQQYLYDREGVRREVKGSAPGEAPAKITGAILKSLKVIASKSGLSVRIAAADPKAHLMEYGTIEDRTPAARKRKRVKVTQRTDTDVFHVAPRPFLRPALAAKKKEIIEALELGLLNGLRVALGLKAGK